MIPGLQVGRDGFAAKHPSADRFRFPSPSTIWKPISTTAMGQTVVLSGNRGPDKLRIDLLSPGFMLHVQQGLELDIGSTGAPYLTWNGGTVTDGVPTPPSPWLMISFTTPQPPIVLGFPAGPTSLMVTGQPGAWRVRSLPGAGGKPFQGWVRVVLPAGTRPLAANTPRALGLLARRVASEANVWSGPHPMLKALSIEADAMSVTATWTFDRSGVVVPTGATLARRGGYALSILSKTRPVDADTDAGPMDITVVPRLVVRFPLRRVPLGRAVTLGARRGTPPGTVSAQDLPSVFDLAMESLLASSDQQVAKAAAEAQSAFLTQASITPEPWTGARLPYDAQGKGIDIASAQALLAQALANSRLSPSMPDALFPSVVLRRDWHTWGLWVPEDGSLRRRAAALAALAGALAPEPERRLEAAMLQAGLSAERGLALWAMRRGLAPSLPPMLEAALPVRRALFSLGLAEVHETPFLRAILSDLRAFGDTPLTLAPGSGAPTLSWPALGPRPAAFTLLSAYPLGELTPLENLVKVEPRRSLGYTEVRYVADVAGQCRATLKLPPWARPLPPTAEPPRYGEEMR